MKYKIRNLLNKIIYNFFSPTIKKIIDEKYFQFSTSTSSIQANIKLEREKLVNIRNSKQYNFPFKKKNPLVSVRIATFNRAEILVNKTIPSILAQDHKNFEIIIVGDHCTDDTEKRIKKMKDKRISFFNMPYRGYYPQNDFQKWLVAGTPAANEALQRTKGDWICPFDDDDEMTQDHISKLLRKAQIDHLEFVYGNAKSINLKTKEERIIGSFPPQYGHISFNSSIFHKDLKFFEYDPLAWTLNEPGDWNTIKRMMLAGVYVGYINESITNINFIHPELKTGHNPEL